MDEKCRSLYAVGEREMIEGEEMVRLIRCKLPADHEGLCQIDTNELLTRLEKHMSALTDAVNKLTTAVAANTTAVNAVPSASDAATATAAVDAATTQLTTNNATLAGDVAPAA